MPLTRQHKPGDMRPSCHIWYRTAWFGLTVRRNIEPLKNMRPRDWECGRVGRSGYPRGDEGGGMGRERISGQAERGLTT